MVGGGLWRQASRRRRFAAGALLVGGLLAVLFGIWLLWPMSLELPSSAAAATRIYDRNGQLLYDLGDPQAGVRAKVPLAEVPLYLWEATIAAEDANFYDNPGIDVKGIVRALWLNLRGGHVVAGGSTITQQVARNAFLSPQDRASRSLWRKVREAALAVKVNLHFSKDEVLATYLNDTYYGNFAYGAAAAAQVYFGKPLRDLDLAESALLAGLPQAPSDYNPLENLPAARSRQADVLALMVRNGYISQQQADEAANEKLHFVSQSFPLRAPHFVAYVLEQLREKYGSTQGLVVHTSIDLNLQQRAEEVVARQIADLAEKDASSAAVVALDVHTGEILAMVGSADYFDAGIDGAVNVAVALRQPGSAIKPLLYAAAFEGSLTPASLIADVPTTFLDEQGQPYNPENYDRQWHGPVLARQALANSYNLPAVKVLQQVGIPTFLSRLASFGLSELASRSSGGLGLALGSGEVSLLDLTSAYAVLASGGIRRSPVAITEVSDEHGRILWQWHATAGERVIDPRVAYLVTDILADNLARAATFGEDSPLELDRPAAVKTGTTSNWRDNWTVGYTPDLVAGVWVGNPDNHPMQEIAGVTGAAPVWHDFMEEALRGQPETAFAEPEGLVHVEICPLTGDLPSPWCPDRKEEVFIRGTEPTKVCTAHVPVAVCTATGAPDDGSCPEGKVETRVYVDLEGELSDWARDHGLGLPANAIPSPQTGAKDDRLRVALTSPDPQALIQISRELDLSVQRLEVQARIESGEAARVDLLVDDRLIASLEQTPYRAFWPLMAGKHTFRAVAYDQSRNQAASETVIVDVVP